MIREEILEGQCFSQLSWDGASKVGAKELPFSTLIQPSLLQCAHVTVQIPLNSLQFQGGGKGAGILGSNEQCSQRGMTCSSPNREVAEEEDRGGHVN